jgi:hypothetical protein
VGGLSVEVDALEVGLDPGRRIGADFRPYVDDGRHQAIEGDPPKVTL